MRKASIGPYGIYPLIPPVRMWYLYSIMIISTNVKSGQVLKFGEDFFKVTESLTHAGGGKTGTMVHMKLKSLSTGHVTERRFAATDKLDDVPITRVKMQFLFREGDAFTFMNPETFDQIPLQKEAIGAAAKFLKENDEIEVEFFEEKALAVNFSPTVELKVTTTGEGIKGQTKEAILENDLEILVPEFVKEGDRVRVDVETGKYLSRINEREEKGAKFSVPAPEVKGESKTKKPEEKKPEE